MIEGVNNPVNPTPNHPTRSGNPPSKEAQIQERFAMKDEIELSGTARQHLEDGDATPIRHGLVERVRAEIAAGDYLTKDKIDAVVNAVHRQLYAA